MSQTDIFVINECLDAIRFLDDKIEATKSRIFQSLTGLQKDMEILMSVRGIDFKAAAAILAEIGKIDVFPKPKNLVSWIGLAPSISESAGKSASGHITKRGNKYLRTILVEVANTIAIGKPNKLKFFFMKIKSKKGHKKSRSRSCQKIGVHHSSLA